VPQATIKIVHVYSGPKSLKGTTFIQQTSDGGKGSLLTIAIPLLKVGESGRWVLGVDEKGNWNIVQRGYREADTLKYNRETEWAESVERLVKLKVGERLKLAKELCGHKNPDVAELGIEVLFGAWAPDAERAGVPEFVKGLPKNRHVTRFALVRADCLAAEQHGKKWIASEYRKALLERLTDEVLTDEEGEEIAHHLVVPSPWTTELFTIQDVSRPLGKIANNPRQSKAVRSSAVKMLISAAIRNNARGDGAVFDILAEVVKRDTDDAVRLQAAQGFVTLARGPMPPKPPAASYSAAQLDVLRGLLKDERNEAVAKTLQSALDKAK
jgi:hypothetical protein